MKGSASVTGDGIFLFFILLSKAELELYFFRAYNSQLLMELPFFFFSFLLAAALYLLQSYLYNKTGNAQKSGSLSFAVICGMLAFFWFKQFDTITFLYGLLAIVGLIVGISSFRDDDCPRWLHVVLMVTHLFQLGCTVYIYNNM